VPHRQRHLASAFRRLRCGRPYSLPSHPSQPETLETLLNCGGSCSCIWAGTPIGLCNHSASPFSVDPSCHSPNAVHVVTGLCVGQSACTVSAGWATFFLFRSVATPAVVQVLASNNVFGGDPCHAVVKRLAVQVECSSGGKCCLLDLCGRGAAPTWVLQILCAAAAAAVPRS
jgi:hypothetical protein